MFLSLCPHLQLHKVYKYPLPKLGLQGPPTHDGFFEFDILGTYLGSSYIPF